MAPSDLSKKKRNTEKKPDAEALVIHGTSGTEISGGIITEDYNADLQFPDSVGIYDEMRKSDGTVGAILEAIKTPLLSAKWQIRSGGEEPDDKEIAEFVQRNLFGKIRFQNFLKEALGFLDFGFYYFEKVFEISGGMVEWKEFAPRVPKSHYLWGFREEKKWEGWHPKGVTQQILTSDESGDGNLYPEIPWGKLILLSRDREGNNFEGVSVLRKAYKHYFYKDLLYRVSSISSERYGVGTPVAKVKTSMGQKQQDKLVEFLKNIRSNEQSYGVYTTDVEEFKIMTPEGTGAGSQIKDMIDHHDGKIYGSILAGFLNLSSGDGGSNALSKDQSSFFLRGLQSVADYFIDAMDEHIRELVDYNFSGVENYPTLMVSEIGSISMDEAIGAINTAVTGGLIELNDTDKDAIRAILKLPPRPPADESDIEMDAIEAELEMESMEIDSLESFGDAGANAENPEEEAAPTEESDVAMSEEEETYNEFEGMETGELMAMLADTRAPMTEETKKKISEALTKNHVKDGGEKIQKQTKSEFVQWDPAIGRFQAQKSDVKSKIESVKLALQSIKDKRSSMNKDQKKKFAEEFKKKVAEIKAERLALQTVGAKLREYENKRASELKTAYTKGKSDLKRAKETDKATERAGKEKARVEKKTAKEAEAKTKKATREAEAVAKKAEAAKKKGKNLAEEQAKPTDREKAFTSNVTAFEKFLDGKYAEAEKIVRESEKEMQVELDALYSESESRRVDGVVCLVYDRKMVTRWKNKIQNIADRLQKKLIDSDLQKEIFKEAISAANSTLDKNDSYFSGKRVEIIGKAQIDTFIAGYTSNMQGVIYNESRRVLENITLNYGSEASVDLAHESAKAVSFNKNILSLSFVTHPRALYKYVVYDAAQAEGFTFFKTIVPTDKLPNVAERPFGMTASMIFKIRTAAQINKEASAMTAGKTAEAVTGLGLHHGSFEYYYPIASSDLPMEEAIAKKQLEDLQSMMDFNQ